MRDEECCCDDCCEESGGPPTAAFSYIVTDDSPLKIDLNDESTAGTCGEIVAWRWLVNGVEVSTAQNPTGIEVDASDDITLEITDAEGCEDEVTETLAIVVDCTEFSALVADFPDIDWGMSMTAAFVDASIDCDCDLIPSTETVPYFGSNLWNKNRDDGGCFANSVSSQYNVLITCSGGVVSIRATISTGVASGGGLSSFYRWTKTIALPASVSQIIAPHTLTATFTAGDPLRCNGTAATTSLSITPL